MHRAISILTFLAVGLLNHLNSSVKAASLGIFQAEQDVGATQRAGSVKTGKTDSEYIVAGGGANMWFTNDALHFVWKKVSGDLALTSEIAFLTKGGDVHRKACLILRQDLDPDSAYVDAALHGDGLTSLQFRE